MSSFGLAIYFKIFMKNSTSTVSKEIFEISDENGIPAFFNSFSNKYAFDEALSKIAISLYSKPDFIKLFISFVK